MMLTSHSMPSPIQVFRNFNHSKFLKLACFDDKAFIFPSEMKADDDATAIHVDHLELMLSCSMGSDSMILKDAFLLLFPRLKTFSIYLKLPGGKPLMFQSEDFISKP